MAKYIQIGALVEKEHGLEAYNNVSTSNGVMTGKQAKQEKVGGELLCYVY